MVDLSDRVVRAPLGRARRPALPLRPRGGYAVRLHHDPPDPAREILARGAAAFVLSRHGDLPTTADSGRIDAAPIPGPSGDIVNRAKCDM